tara:strand:- start:1468 stop:2004 length:537 start_codon:yes stop_codon:yes gene_type:complete
MRIAITGTPGTGKTTCSKNITQGCEILHLNDIIKEKKLYQGFDENRQTLIADIKAIEKHLDGKDNIVIDSHISHLLEVDKVIVLRCHPIELKKRLEGREYNEEIDIEKSIEENVKAESLDVILVESVEIHGESRVYEIDGTGKEPRVIVQEIEAAIAGDRDPEVGLVSFIEYMFEESG